MEVLPDEVDQEILDIVQSELTVEQKLEKLFVLDPQFATFTSGRLGKMLGVTDAMIRQLPIWLKLKEE